MEDWTSLEITTESNKTMKKPNKIWIITGAARGFGQQISKAVLATGDIVTATVRSRPEELKAQLGTPPNLHVAILDITNGDQARNVAAEAVKNFGRIDVLVNNAGSGLLSAVEEATDEEVKRNYETNVFGLLKVTRAVLPHMRRQRSGHVINFYLRRRTPRFSRLGFVLLNKICGRRDHRGHGHRTRPARHSRHDR